MTSIGPYAVLGKLGEGGMGEVFRASDAKLKRQVAIKVLPAAFASDPERLARFEREAHVLASLNHSNIAAIYGFEDSTSVKALVMELVEGPTLADLIATRKLGADEAWTIARQIADALEAAHALGVIHRDLKPANVKVRDDGTVKVLDFGLAKALGPEGPSATMGATSTQVGNAQTMTSPAMMSQMGMILGTAAYMSPEQARGRTVDRRADIWAFGAVLYEMLTGEAPFAGETITDVLAAVVTKEPDLTRVPPKFRRVVERCLQKDPRQRLRDVGDIDLLLGATPAANTTSPSTRPAWLPWSVAALFAMASIVVGWLYLRTPQAAPPRMVRFEIGAGLKGVQSGQAALSPDGRTLAYWAGEADGSFRVHLRQLDSLEERVLAATRVTFGTQRPFWSADGQYLAFWTGETGTMKVRLPDGSPEPLIRGGERALGGAWSRDNVIVIGSAGAPLRVVQANGAITEGSAPNREAGDRGDSYPEFLPDGRHLMFQRQSVNAERNGLWITSLDDPKSDRLLVAATAGTFAGDVPGLGPTILFSRNERLLAQPIDLGRLEPIGEPRDVMAIGNSGFSVSRDGTLVYGDVVAQRAGRLVWFDRAGTPIGTVDTDQIYQSFSLSADGSRLAVARGAGRGAGRGGGAEMWIRDLERGTELRLGVDQSGLPLLSRDGSQLLFNSYKLGPAAIYARPSNGTGIERLVAKEDSDIFPNDWSEDGRFVIYSRLIGAGTNASQMDLFTLPVGDAGGKAMPYVAEPAHQKQARFSPNGRFVAYASNETGRFEIYVRPFPDASLGKWPISSTGGFEPRWSHDGKELFYWSGKTLMAASVTLTPAFSAGRSRELFEAPIQAGYTNDGHRWQVAPDDKRFLVLTFPEDQSSPIKVVLNWWGMIGG